MRLSLVAILCVFFTASYSQTLPDYFIENVVIDKTEVRKDEPITVSYDLSVDTEGFTTPVSLYLSDDLILSTGDILLVTWNSPLGANQYPLSIPNRVELGLKNVILVVNKDFTRRESNYSNNITTASTTLNVIERVRGDILAESWTLDASDVIVEDFITSTLTVSNSILSGSFAVSYLLSEDSVFDTDDYLLEFSQDVFASQSPGTALNIQFQIPEAVDPGKWQLLAVLDPDGRYYESDENNNLVIHEIFVNPKPTTNYDVTFTSIGTDFERGEFVNFQYIVSETENDINASTSSGLYLSRDSVFSTDDRLLATDATTIPENTEGLNFTIPQNIDTGYYELLIVADYNLETKETNESDNIGIHRIHIISSPRPDLAFDEILFNGVLSAGQSYSNQAYTFSNLTGINQNGNFEISFFLSEDSVLDNTDILLYNDPTESVPTGTTVQNRLANFTMQTDIDSGEYLLLSYLDFIDEIDEDDELNNDTIIAITVVNPDLTVGIFNSTETVSGAGLSIPITVQVDNISETNGYAAPSKLSFFLSEDDQPDPTDIKLSQIDIPAINAGFNTGELGRTITFPNTIDAGDYFLLAFTDPDSLLSENVEDNNWTSLPITIQLPDLQVKSPIINPSTITAGKTVTLEFRVDNNADIPSPQSLVKIYLSEDLTLEPVNDIFLTSSVIEALDAQGSSTNKVLNNVGIPEIDQGDYKILFAVDADSLISESDETNNISSGDISLTNPDILPLNLDLAKDLVGSGETVNMDFVFTNQGTGNIDATSYTIFLNGNSLQEEIYLGEGIVESLVASATSSLKAEAITIPSYVELGTYYVKVYADWGDSALESDETNNADSILLEVTNPDLRPTNIIASPNIISVGFPVTIELDVENIGEVDAPATTMTFVLSTDEIVDENDFFYSSVGVPAIDSLKDVTLSNQLTIPSFISPGEYFMIVDVDPLDLIPELNENNNRITVSITVNVPDLEILNEGLDKTVVGSSEVIAIEARVTNTSSNAKSPASTVAYYLSENTTKDNDDILAGQISVESLELGATSTNKVQNFTIPAEIEAGDYNILFSADDPDDVNELDETNNLVSLPVTITNPDLTPSSLVLSKSSLELSESFNVSVNVSNIGDSPSASGTIEYYLSTESTALNDSSIYLGTNTHGVLAVAEDVLLENKQVSIPSFLDPADYFLLVFVDPDSTIAETNEANNIVSSSINLLFADLTTINQEIDKASVAVGDTLTVTYNLKNNGDVSSNTSITSFFLAANDTTSLSNFNESEPVVVANGTASAKDIKLVIPFSVKPGDYKLGIEVDTFDNTIESNEDNNVSTLDVTITPIDLVAVSAYTFPSRIEPDSTNFNDQSYQVVDFAIEATATIDPTLIQNELPNALLIANVYISDDNIYDESDTLILVNNRRIVTTPDELSYAVIGKALFPFNIPKGDQFVIFELDGNYLLDEEDETNNFIALPITYDDAIKPDIVAVEQQIIPSTLTINKDVRVIHHSTNDGANRTRRYDNAIYLSVDQTYDTSDDLFASGEIDSSNPGLDEYAVYDLELPGSLTEGTNYLIGIDDEFDKVTEQREDNNSIVSEFEYYAPLPIDFAPTCTIQLPEVILSGDSFNFVYEIENLGTGIPENLGTSVGENFLSVRIYLSDDQSVSEDDLSIHTGWAKAVSPHEITGYKRNLVVPDFIAPGTYYVIIKVDSEEEYSESDETNNELALEVSVEDPIQPDLAITFANNSLSAQANTEIFSNLEVSNLGGTNLSNVDVAFYINDINVFSEDLPRLQLVNNEISVTAYQNAQNRSFSPVIPFDTKPGRYIIFARIDDSNLVDESDETNNIASAAIEVLDAIAPDFTINKVTQAITAYEGELTDISYPLSYYARNNGTKADIFDVKIYFSLDDQFDSQDAVLNEESIFLSGSGNQIFKTASLEFPNLLAGEYYVFIVADPQDEKLELDEDNNIATIPLDVRPPSKPDVSPESGLSVANNTIGLNGVIEITQVIYNLDRAPIDSTLVSFYISTDPTVSTNDLLLTQFYSGAISGNGNASVNASEIIPTSLGIGDYFLISVLDDDNRLDESDESNNEEFIAIILTEEVQPDFIPSIDGLASLNVSANTTVNIDYSIFNNGSGAALTYDVSFYLSKDDVLDGSDIFISSTSFGLLEGGQSDLANENLLIPVAAAPGSYNLLLIADPDALVAEGDETNNLDLVAIEILEPELPDLTGTLNSVPAFVNAREILEVNLITQNGGLGAAGESVNGIYLSEDEIVDANDVLLGSDPSMSLLSGDSELSVFSLTIPDVTAGNYFLLGEVDKDGQIAESDEDNNVTSVAIEVGDPIFSDLIVNSVTLTDVSVNAGNDIEIVAVVENIGDNQSTETEIAFYLSSDEVLDTNDTNLGTEMVNGIQSMGTSSVNATVTLPASTVVGYYFVIAEVNPNQVLEEADYDNNTNSTGIEALERLLADLQVSFASVQPTSIPAGQNWNLSISIFNLGGGSSVGFDTDIYLSVDGSISGDDLLLSSIMVNPIPFGESTIAQANFTIDVSTAIGSYNLIVDLDSNSEVEETDETNNTFAITVDVLDQLRADLLPQSLSLSATSINAGGTIGVSFDVTNQGEITSLADAAGVYFSTDNVLDASDELITTLSLNPLNAGASDSFNASVPVPLDEAPGNYFILVNVDENNLDEESDESNNIAAQGVEVTEPLPGNLTITQLSLSESSVSAGSSITVTATISNTTSNAVLPFSTTIYLSNDQTISAEDEQLDSQTFDILQGQATVNGTFTGTVNASLDPGNYFVIARVDSNQEVTETDENDNDEVVNLEVLEALSANDATSDLIVYPNPTRDELYVLVADQGLNKYLVVDISGKEVLRGRLDKEEYRIDVSTLDSGEYILVLENNGGEDQIRRFVKK